MGRSSRDKGARGEREIRDLLRRAGFRCDRDGTEHGDLRHDCINIHFEVKRQETISIDEWWRQATRDAGARNPVVFFRKNHQRWRAVIDAEFLLELLANQRTGRIIHGDAV